MGDRLQAGKPSWYATSHPGQLSLAIPPWVGAMSTSKSWDVNRHTARCTSSVSVVWQCKLVSGWGLMKRRSAPPYGPCGWGRSLRLRFFTFCHYMIDRWDEWSSLPGDCATAGSIWGTCTSSTLSDFRNKLLERSVRHRSWNIIVPAQEPQTQHKIMEKHHRHQSLV